MPRILVIDDDEDVARATATILTSAGHEAALELDAHKAMDRIAAFQPALIVLDVMFPDNATASFDLAREIRARDRTLPVIMVTSINEHRLPKFSNRDRDPVWLPVSEFVEKPVTKARLLRLVESLLERES